MRQLILFWKKENNNVVKAQFFVHRRIGGFAVIKCTLSLLEDLDPRLRSFEVKPSLVRVNAKCKPTCATRQQVLQRFKNEEELGQYAEQCREQEPLRHLEKSLVSRLQQPLHCSHQLHPAARRDQKICKFSILRYRESQKVQRERKTSAPFLQTSDLDSRTKKRGALRMEFI